MPTMVPLLQGRWNLDDERFEGNTKRVFEFIQEHPGCHLRRIKSELQISMGTTQYHLDKLERTRKVVAHRYGLRKRYFVLGMFGEEETMLLQILGNETARDMLMFISEQSSPTQSDIVERMGLARPSVNWHIKRLLRWGILEEARDGKFKRYKFHGEPKYLVALLRNYYPSVWDRWSNRLAEMFLGLSGGHTLAPEQREEELER